MPIHRRKNVKKVIRKPMAKRAMSMVRSLKREVEGDKKFDDLQYPLTNQTTSSIVTAVSRPPALIGVSGFNQSQITTSFYYLGKSIQLRGVIYAFETAYSATLNNIAYLPSHTRVIVFQDKEVSTSWTAPTAADLLQFPTDIDSPLNQLNVKRFKVLADKVIGVGASPTQAHFKMFVKIPKRTSRIGQQYSSSLSYIPRENQIYVLSYSDDSSNSPMLAWTSRFRFIDT